MTALVRINAQVKSRLGIHIGPHKSYLLEARLGKLCEQEGYDLEALADDLELGRARALEALAVHLTTNHTFFFREGDHFRLLAEWFAPRRTQRLRFWSAAGSSGEEGYSMAMALAEAGFRDFLVLVSDVSPKVLHQAIRGVYEASKVARVPEALRSRYFEPLGSGDLRVGPTLRSRLRFQNLNLLEPLEAAEPLDAVFCRNLLIYFEDQEAEVVLSNIARVLRPGGLLFLGQTEGVRRPPGAFRVIANAVYEKL